VKPNRNPQSNLLAFRLPDDVRRQLPKENLSAFIKEAITEKLEGMKNLVPCPTCKGIGKIRRKSV